MAQESVRYTNNRGSADTSRNPSGFWSDCPWNAIKDGSVSGVIDEDDFTKFPITPATTEGNWGPYTQFSSTSATITAGTGQGGEAIFAGAGDNEGASIRTLATPFKIIRTGKKLWFEARVKSSTITDTKHNILFGLMENTALTAIVPITAAGAIADKNLVGFRRTEAASGGALIDFVYKADGVTAVTTAAALATLVADTYVKLGFVFEPARDPMVMDVAQTSLGKFNISLYVNGVRSATVKQVPSAAGTDFPNDLGLGFFFAVLNATASTPGNSTIDWYRIAQLI